MKDPACAACCCWVGGGGTCPSASPLGSQPVRLPHSLSGILPRCIIPRIPSVLGGQERKRPARTASHPDRASEGKRWTRDLGPAKAFLCDRQSNCLTPEPRGPGGTPGWPAPPRPAACAVSSISSHCWEPRRAAEQRSPAAPAPPWHILQDVLLPLCPPRSVAGHREKQSSVGLGWERAGVRAGLSPVGT